MNVCVRHSERIDVNETSASKKCDICHYWYFLGKGFKFQPMNLSDIAVLNIHGVNYCCIINRISKSAAINLHVKRSKFSILYKEWIKKL